MRKKNKKMYFDAERFNKLFRIIQENYDEETTEATEFKIAIQETAHKIEEMAKKIIFGKRQRGKNKNKKSDPSITKNADDLVNECVCVMLGLLKKQKFDIKKGNSFSFTTRVVQNVILWSQYKTQQLIPFTDFKGISNVIDEEDEDIVLYLEDYMKNNIFEQYDGSDEKDIKNYNTAILNTNSKFDMHLDMCTLRASTDIGSFLECFCETISQIAIQDPSDENVFNMYVIKGIISFLNSQINIDRITSRRLKRHIVEHVIDSIKKGHTTFFGKSVLRINRSNILSMTNEFINNTLRKNMSDDTTIGSILSI